MWQWEEKGTHFNRNEPITGRVSARMAIHSSAVKMSGKEGAKKSTLKPSLQFECVQRPSAGGTWVFTNLNWWFVLCCAETGTPKLAWNVIVSCSVSNFPSAERRYLLSIKHKHMGYAELLSVAEWAEWMYLSSFVRHKCLSCFLQTTARYCLNMADSSVCRRVCGGLTTWYFVSFHNDFTFLSSEQRCLHEPPESSHHVRTVARRQLDVWYLIKGQH